MQIPGSHHADIHVFAGFGALLAHASRDAIIAVDIPIGLSDAAPRAADRAARQFLGRRGSSVFPAPPRAALHASDYHDASARAFAASGKKLSRQSFNILPKIREVDAALRHDPDVATRVFEVHPEVSFAVRNGDLPMSEAKKSPAGRAARLALLPGWASSAYQRALEETRRRDVAHDDIIDALIALWSAARIAEGEARRFPAGGIVRDAAGLPMCIHA